MRAPSPAWAVPLAALVLQEVPALPSVGVSWSLAAPGLVLLLLLRRRLSHRFALFGAMGLLAWCGMLWSAHSALDARLPASLEGTDIRVRGVVHGPIRQREHGVTFAFEIERCLVVASSLACNIPGLVRLGWYGHAPLAGTLWPGDRMQLTVRLKRPVAPLNPGGFDRERWALQQGVSATGYVRKDRKQTPAGARNTMLGGRGLSPSVLLAQLRLRAEGAIGDALGAMSPRAAGVVTALVTGRQSAIEPALWDLFNRTGTSHLMSISGLHVTMFAVMAVWLTRRLLRWPLPGVRGLLTKVSAPSLAWGLAVPAAFAYAAFSGWGVPAQRTCWMLLVAGLAIRLGRVGRLEPVLALAAAVVTLLDPWAVGAPGFWLSFATVAAIVAFGGPARHGPNGGWREAVRAQWAASLALVPLAGYWFGAIPVLGPIANAVAIPLVSALITPMAMAGAALAAAWPELGGVPLWMATKLSSLLIAGLVFLDRSPLVLWTTGSSSWLAMVSAALGTWLMLTPARPVHRLAGFALLVPLLAGVADKRTGTEWSAQVFDVGQGTAVLIRTAGHNLLFDTGPSYGREGSGAGDRIIAPWLRREGIHRIDQLIISHEDRDHSGGAAEIVRQFNVAQVLSSLPREHALRALDVAHQSCTRGRAWQWDGVRFELLHPGPSSIDRAEGRSNEHSCVLRVSGPGGSILLAADIEAAQERELLGRYGTAGLRSSVLLVPHHGSGTSSTREFIAAVAPDLAIVQAGYRNRFRHPAKRVLERYRAEGVRLLRTDRSGAISLEFAPGRAPLVHRARQDTARYWRIGFGE